MLSRKYLNRPALLLAGFLSLGYFISEGTSGIKHDRPDPLGANRLNLSPAEGPRDGSSDPRPIATNAFELATTASSDQASSLN